MVTFTRFWGREDYTGEKNRGGLFSQLPFPSLIIFILPI